jgi:hypothetical protein
VIKALTRMDKMNFVGRGWTRTKWTLSPPVRNCPARRGREQTVPKTWVTTSYRVVDGLQGFLLQLEVSQIIVPKADEPNAVVDFLDAELLSGEHGREVDPLAMQTETSAGGHENLAIVEWIGQYGKAGRSAEWNSLCYTLPQRTVVPTIE